MDSPKIRLLTKDDIEVKVKQITSKGALGLLYKTARVDRAILDDAFGAMNWQCKFEVVNENLYCAIGVYNADIHEWVWKSDCGVESATEAEKGEASDAFKRAGFKWGIGVELYNSPFIWLKVPTAQDQQGHYQLADRFERFEVSDIHINDDRTIDRLVIVDQKSGEVVYSFGDNVPKAQEPKQPEADNATDDGEDKAKDIEDLRKEVLALGATLAITDRQKADDWLHKKFNGDSVAETKERKFLFIAKKIYKNAKKQEDDAIAKKGGNVTLEQADRKGTDFNDNLPF